MEKICMGKYEEHKPVVDIIVNRWVSYDGLHEVEQEYWYCERCKELLEVEEEKEDEEIPY